MGVDNRTARMLLLFITSLQWVSARFGDTEGITEVLSVNNVDTPAPTPKPTLKHQTAIKGAASCAQSRKDRKAPEDKGGKVLGPPGAPMCTNILEDMKDGEWVYGMDHICQSPKPRLSVLCSNNRTVGYAKIDQNKPGAVWRPKKCAIKLFTAAEACSLLNRIGRLVICGESFQRHTYQGMLNVLTDDYAWGSVKCESRFSECEGELQYNEKACSSSYRVGPIPGCGPPGKELLRYETYTQYAYKKLLDGDHGWHTVFGGQTKSSLILMGYGMHDALNAADNKKYAIDPIVKFMKTLPPEKRAHVVWQAVHAQGALKPKQFLKTQGNRPVREYNAKMTTLFNHYNMEVFNVFNMTSGAFSFDGSHYGMTVNVLRSQLILNYIAELAKRDGV